MAAQQPDWKTRLSGLLPSRETLASHPWLKSVAAPLLRPQLWRLNREAVARGVAVGIFAAFAVPVAQIVVAAAYCVWCRANVPVALAMTLLTNPLTIGFWLWLAYQAGALVLGVPEVPGLGAAASTAGWLASVGWPAMLGMGMFGIGGAALGYLAVNAAWRLRSASRRLYRQWAV